MNHENKLEDISFVNKYRFSNISKFILVILIESVNKTNT
jgi:hypothetical protein